MLLRTWLGGVAATAALLAVVVPAAGAQSYDPATDPKARQAAAEIERTRQRADAAAAELSRVSQDRERLTIEVEQAQRERDAAAAGMAALRTGAADLALSRYVRDSSSLDNLVALAGDPSLAVRAATYLQIATGQARDAEGELKAAREDLEYRAAVLDAHRVQLQANEEALAAAQARFERELVQLQEAERRRQAEAAVAAEVARRRAEEARRAAAAEAARQQAAAAQAARTTTSQAARPSAAQAGSARPPAGGASPAPAPAAPAPAPQFGIVCPVAGATAFGDTWGDPRPGRWGHEGVDLMGSSGQPILAAESGTIRHSQSRSGGNQVWLFGDSGTRYFYAHLSSYAGGPRRVSAGEVIGGMGMTGLTGAVHLHFEIRPGGGGPINPYPAVRAVC